MWSGRVHPPIYNVRYNALARQTGARLRVTSPQPPSFRQRIATAQERDECLFGFLLSPVQFDRFHLTAGDGRQTRLCIETT